MKTAEEYRDIFLNKPVYDAVKVLPEVIEQFGHEGKIIFDKAIVYDNFQWNHSIEGFCIGQDKILYANIYWQGDLTDGNHWEPVKNLIYGKTIPAEWSDGHYCVHSSLRIDAEEFEKAIRSLGRYYLDPEEIEKRNGERRMYALECRAMEIFVRPLWKRGWSIFSPSYHNAQNAVWELIRQEYEKLEKLSDEELIPIFKTVWDKNAKKYKIEKFDITY